MPDAETLLKEKSIRITPMRQLVLEYFLAENKTSGLAELEGIFPRADRITLYRTLKTFEEKGILHRIDNGVSEVKYALCKEHCTEAQHIDRHPHFHCRVCGQVVCLEEVFIPQLPLPAGYQSEETEMTIRGVCPDCAR